MERKYIGSDCYLCLDSKAEVVRSDESMRISLTATEYKIFTFFVDRMDRPLSLEKLAILLWGPNYDAEHNQPESIKSHITRIRSKLNKISLALANRLETNYGFNSYTFKADQQKAVQNAPTPVSANHQNPVSSGIDTTVHQATYFDLLALGYTSLSIAESLVQNDWKLYGSLGSSNQLTQENEGSAMQWAEYLSSVPDSFRYLLNKDNQIVGNFSFISISAEQEAAFKAGQLSESMFSPAETRDLFCAGDDHILFLLNLSLNDEYSTPRNNSMLRQMFLSQLLLFAEEDVLFRKIIVNVFKASHEAFFKQWGFSFVKDHKNSGRIYELPLKPYPDKLYNQLKKNRHLRDVNEKLKNIYGEQSHGLSKSL